MGALTRRGQGYAVEVQSDALASAEYRALEPAPSEGYGWLGAMLFALPAIRNTMPGVPGTGTLADYTVYFWAILTVALCLLVIGITYICRTIKVEEHGK
jgi:uncharacterized protein DUF4436